MENLTEMVFILDRSGSMAGLEKDTIGGFNSLLEKQKKEKGKALVTTMLFDDDFTLVHDRQPIHRVAPLTEEQYFVRGCTALLDAIGLTISHIKKARKEMPKEERPDRAVRYVLGETITRARGAELPCMMAQAIGTGWSEEIEQDYKKRHK